MDIKIGKTHRVRLDKNDLMQLKTNNSLAENFQISPSISFVTEVVCNKNNKRSQILFNQNKVIFFLSESDLYEISEGKLKKEGLNLDSYNIQVDLWDETKRMQSKG